MNGYYEIHSTDKLRMFVDREYTVFLQEVGVSESHVELIITSQLMTCPPLPAPPAPHEKEFASFNWPGWKTVVTTLLASAITAIATKEAELLEIIRELSDSAVEYNDQEPCERSGPFHVVIAPSAEASKKLFALLFPSGPFADGTVAPSAATLYERPFSEN